MRKKYGLFNMSNYSIVNNFGKAIQIYDTSFSHTHKEARKLLINRQSYNGLISTKKILDIKKFCNEVINFKQY